MTPANTYRRSAAAKIKLDRLRRSILNPHVKSIEKELRALGADSYNLLLPETRFLPLVIRTDETVVGIVYGRYKVGSDQVGRGALVATDQRILLIDKKPSYLHSQELKYKSISSAAYSRVGAAGTVTLTTSAGNLSIRTFNLRCAHNFVRATDKQLLEDRADRLSPLS